MKASQRTASETRAVIEKPPLAVVATGDGAAPVATPQTAQHREARIREAAYARYESRGRVDGHATEDWLAAEAELPE